MMKSQIDSLNTTISNSPSKYYVKSPFGSSQGFSTKKTLEIPSGLVRHSGELMTQVEQHQILFLEIEQLKQENKFLKKKIHELSTNLQADHIRTKALIQKEKDDISKQIDSLPLSIDFFFEEINNLLSSFNKLFRLDINTEHFTIMTEENEKENFCPIKKYALLKKFHLKRRIQRIMLQDETKQFQKSITLFMQYYTAKEESERKIVEKVDQMMTKMSHLNKTLLLKAQQCKRSNSEVCMPHCISPEHTPQQIVKQTFHPKPINVINRSNTTDHSQPNSGKLFKRTNKLISHN